MTLLNYTLYMIPLHSLLLEADIFNIKNVAKGARECLNTNYYINDVYMIILIHEYIKEGILVYILYSCCLRMEKGKTF